jgi:hypothetical protein
MLIYAVCDLYILNILTLFLGICTIPFIFLVIFQMVRLPFKFYRKKPEASYIRLLIIYFSLCLFFGCQAAVSGAIMNYKARAEIKNVLKGMNVNEVVITIDGIETQQKEILFESLQKLQYIDNKGGRTHRVQCEITDSGQKLLLILSRNTVGNNSFVVYYPKYYMTRRNVIGGFYSDSIDLKNP